MSKRPNFIAKTLARVQAALSTPEGAELQLLALKLSSAYKTECDAYLLDPVQDAEFLDWVVENSSRPLLGGSRPKGGSLVLLKTTGGNDLRLCEFNADISEQMRAQGKAGNSFGEFGDTWEQ